MRKPLALLTGWNLAGHALVALLLVAALVAIGWIAPEEETMGQVQRVLYVHVAVAWFALAAFIAAAVAGLAYLVRRDLGWDHWAQAATEVGWLSAGLTLVTGSLWAHEAWGTWWTWDPRLTTAFILWAMYTGTLLLRSAVDDPHRRARVGAVLAMLGAIDVPMVVLATRWFRGMHPVSPEIDPTMRWVMLVSAVAFTALLTTIVIRRRGLLRLEHLAALCRRRAVADL